MHLVTFYFACLSLFTQLCPLAAATLFNVTVDDQLGDPLTGAHILYTPSEAWVTVSNDPSDTPPLDFQQIHNRTLHDSLFSSKNGAEIARPNSPRLATLNFNGSAVYVTCIIAPNTSNFTGDSDMTFYIDGEIVGQYSRPSASDTFEYNQTVYANTSLTMATHSLIIQSGQFNGPDVIIRLDSITYSTNSPSVTRSDKRAVIVGAILGGLAVLPLCGLAFFLYRRRSCRHSVPIVQSNTPANSMRNWRGRATNVLKFSFICQVWHVHTARREGEQTMRQVSNKRNAVLDESVVHSSTSAPIPSSWTHSITAWQQNTRQATQGVDLAPPDMSEELSSYYDDATQTESRRPRTPPPPPRLFTVRNV